MIELFRSALTGDSHALGGVASIIAILALVPAAAIFVVNQLLENLRLREEKYRFLHDQYVDYLKLCLAYPEFGLERGPARPYRDFDPIEKQKISLIFEIFTSMVEAAFKAFQSSMRSSRKTQWQGWVAYLDDYLDRIDYFEFVIDWLYGGDVSLLPNGELQVTFEGSSEYDKEFDQFLLERLRAAWTRREHACAV